MFADYDDLTVVSNDISRAKGLALLAIVRNEMYILPEFLRHYRSAGIKRFIILDDRSDDGTREFLCEQADVMVVESQSRFGQIIAPHGRVPLPDMRTLIVWRNVMMWKYASGQWAVMLDADEFLTIPQGMSLEDVTRVADEEGRRAIHGVMLDCYPRDIRDLQAEGAFDAEGDWYFDGQRHLRLKPNGALSVAYPGARARLLATYGVRKLALRNRLRNLVKDPWFPGFNANQKVILHRWGDSDLFLNSHRTTAQQSGRILLPIKHFKFNRDVYKKVEIAMREQQHREVTVEYDALAVLLDRMARKGGTFRYRLSRSTNSFDAFVDTGNALLG